MLNKNLKKRGYAITVMSCGKKTPVILSDKGVATVAAIKSGLLPKIKGGWDDSAFQKFWSLYEKMLEERNESLFRASVDNGGYRHGKTF